MFKNLDEFNDKIAVITEKHECIKYIQLAKCIKQISGYLYNSEQDAFSLTDKKTKSLVFIVASNTYGCLAGYLASIISGNTAMMLDENTNSDILDNLNDLYKPDLLWCPKNFETKPEDNVIINFLGYKLIKMNHNYCDGYQINSDVALLLSTSGSTGSRKMVKISYKNLESNANSIIQYLGLNENDKTIVSLPLSYSYGLSIVNTHLSVGATIIFTKEKMYSSAYWRLFDDEKVTTIAKTKHNIPTADTLICVGKVICGVPFYVNISGEETPYHAQIPFFDYCLGVVAGEAEYDYLNGEARKAIAVAIKTFTWHHMIKNNNSFYGINLKPDLQAYKPSRINAKIRLDFNRVKNVWMESEEGYIFEAHYYKGKDELVKQHYGKSGGALYQDGCYYLYKDYKMNYKNMLRYYYNDSIINKGEGQRECHVGKVCFFDSNKKCYK